MFFVKILKTIKNITVPTKESIIAVTNSLFKTLAPLTAGACPPQK